MLNNKLPYLSLMDSSKTRYRLLKENRIKSSSAADRKRLTNTDEFTDDFRHPDAYHK
jgi:hypothetical protein